MFRLLKNLFSSPENLLNVLCSEDMEEARQEKEAILIDEDGNASVNTDSPEMKASFARHVAALRNAGGRDIDDSHAGS